MLLNLKIIITRELSNNEQEKPKIKDLINDSFFILFLNFSKPNSFIILPPLLSLKELKTDKRLVLF